MSLQQEPPAPTTRISPAMTPSVGGDAAAAQLRLINVGPSVDGWHVHLAFHRPRQPGHHDSTRDHRGDWLSLAARRNPAIFEQQPCHDRDGLHELTPCAEP